MTVIPPLGSASPEVRVERIGSQVVANTMGRVAMLATDVDDELVHHDNSSVQWVVQG